MSAVYAIKDHFISWYFGTNEGEWVSMGIYTENEPYGIPNNLIFSLPVRCKNFEYEIVKDLILSDFSKEKIKKSTEELFTEKAEAE